VCFSLFVDAPQGLIALLHLSHRFKSLASSGFGDTEEKAHFNGIVKPCGSGPRLWRIPAAARRSKVPRKTLTRSEMSWLLRLGFATAAIRLMVRTTSAPDELRPAIGAGPRLCRMQSPSRTPCDLHGKFPTVPLQYSEIPNGMALPSPESPMAHGQLKKPQDERDLQTNRNWQ